MAWRTDQQLRQDCDAVAGGDHPQDVLHPVDRVDGSRREISSRAELSQPLGIAGRRFRGWTQENLVAQRLYADFGGGVLRTTMSGWQDGDHRTSHQLSGIEPPLKGSA